MIKCSYIIVITIPIYNVGRPRDCERKERKAEGVTSGRRRRSIMRSGKENKLGRIHEVTSPLHKGSDKDEPIINHFRSKIKSDNMRKHVYI